MNTYPPDVLATACPYCRARPGFRCRGTSLDRRHRGLPKPHKARVETAHTLNSLILCTVDETVGAAESHTDGLATFTWYPDNPH